MRRKSPQAETMFIQTAIRICPKPSERFVLTSFVILGYWSHPRPCRNLCHPFQDAETVGRVLAQIDKCNGYILGSHDTAAPGGASGTGVSNLFRTAFSDTHEPMFERIGSIQERYMPESFGGVPPEFLMSGTGDARVNVQSERSSPSQTEKPGD